MAEQIEANYEVLEQVVSKFTQLCQDVGNMRQYLNNSYEPLADGGWQGDAAEAYFSEVRDEVGPQCRRLQEAFEQAAEATKKVAATMEQAEEEAGNNFQVF
jgi:WXG100 family type VII secretion target